MKLKLLMLTLFLLFTGTVALYHSDNHVNAKECATCSSSGICKACKNCKYCKHCSKNGGTCSVCK